MACDAQSLINLAASGGFFALSERDLKIASLWALCTGPGVGATAQQLIDGGYAAGYDKLSDRQLAECFLVIICSNVNSQVLSSGLAQLPGAPGYVTVPSTSVTSTTPILLTYFSLNGNVATVSYGTIVNGVSFRITSTNGTDTNMVAWAILKP